MKDLYESSFELIDTLPERKVFKHKYTGDMFLTALEEDYPGHIYPPIRVLRGPIMVYVAVMSTTVRLTMPILAFDHPNSEDVTQLTVEEALFFRDQYDYAIVCMTDDMTTRNLRELFEGIELRKDDG